MSREYGIYTTLGLSFTQENMQILIQKTSAIGFIYLTEKEDKELFNIKIRYFTIDQAISKLLMMAERMDEYDLPFLHVKYQDTDFYFRLYENKNKLIEMGIGVFGFCWNKHPEYGDNESTIDFSRYIRLLLNVCSDITLLRLETYSDSVENMQYTGQECVTLLTHLGTFEETFSGSLKSVKGCLMGFICNGLESKFIFLDENIQQSIEPSIQKYYEILEAGFPAYLYAKKDDISFKIEIKQNVQGYDRVLIYPLKPYRMKKGYGSEEEKIDVAFYVERLLELCENFAIYELKTFL